MWFIDLLDKTNNTYEKIKEGFSNIGQWFSDLKINQGVLFSDLGSKIWKWFDDLNINQGVLFSDLGSNLSNWFIDLGTDIGTFFTDLWDNISTLPNTISTLFRQLFEFLFIPDSNYFDYHIEEIKNALNEKIPYHQYVDSLKDIESITDLTGDTDEITVGIDFNNYSVLDKLTINMSNFIDFSIFSEYKETWYSWVRVVVYIGLVIYNINQTIKMFNGFTAVDGSIRDVQNNFSGGNDKK